MKKFIFATAIPGYPDIAGYPVSGKESIRPNRNSWYLRSSDIKYLFCFLSLYHTYLFLVNIEQKNIFTSWENVFVLGSRLYTSPVWYPQFLEAIYPWNDWSFSALRWWMKLRQGLNRCKFAKLKYLLFIIKVTASLETSQ